MKLLPNSAVIDDHASVLPTAPSQVRPVTNRSSLRIIGEWIERSRQRRALADLDDRLLDDVRILRSAAEREIATPFWR